MFVSFLMPFVDRGQGPLSSWVMFKQFADLGKTNLIAIADDRYFRTAGVPFGLDKDLSGFRFRIPSRSEFDAVSKIAIPGKVFTEISRTAVSHLDIFRHLLTQEYEPLTVELTNVFERLRGDGTHIEAVLTWCNCPSLTKAASASGWPVIHCERGPFRPPLYQHTTYFDFKGVNGRTDAEHLCKAFINEAKNAREFHPLPRNALRRLLCVNYDALNMRRRVRPAEYQAGVAMQVEDDSNVVAFSNGLTPMDVIHTAQQKSNNEKILVRKHPKGHVDYTEDLGVLDTSPDSFSFLSKCERVFTLNSSVAFECLLFGKPVYVLGDSPAAFLSQEKLRTMPEEDLLLCLNFLFIAYLVPAGFLFDKDYMRWRLGMPPQMEIYQRHRLAYESLHSERHHVPNSG